MDNDLGKNARAAEWLKMTAGKWRLQTLQHRGRYDVKTGKYKELPTRLRRFLNGTPVGLVGPVLALLKSSAPYKSPVFNWEYDDGLEYRPTNTLIRKDGPEMTTNGKDATYTIIQDLRLVDENGETLDAGDDSSCSRESTAEYHWDESSVENCPKGTQGVSYRVQNINRDGETDLFSYTLVKTVALTQHVPEHTVKCDSRRRVTVETWDNVYGSPGDFRYDEANGGTKISVPAPCDDENGTSTELSTQENADCTFKIQITRSYANADDRAFSIYRDQYKTQETVSDVNQPFPLPRSGVEYANGVIKKYTSEKNEDGTWNNSVETDTERSVPGSTIEVRAMPRYSVETVVDTNQPEPAVILPGTFGSVKSTKTPGGLFTNERTTYVRNVIDRLGVSCEDTAFIHSHEKSGTAESIEDGHVPSASGGRVTKWSFSVDETTGAVNRTVSTRQEHTVDGSTKSKSTTLIGSTVSYGSRSVSAATANGLLSGVGVGESVSVRMTDGKLWDVEVSSFTKNYGAKLSAECSKTFFKHEHTEATVVKDIDGEASEAGDGFTYRRTFSVDPQHGTVTMHEGYGYEKPRPGSGGSVRIGARSVVTSVTNTQVGSRSEASRVGESVEWRMTDGGMINETVTKSVPRAGTFGSECSMTLFQHQHATSKVRTGGPSAEGDVNAASGGVIQQRSERLEDDGSWTVSEQETTELPVMESSVETQMTPRGLVTRTTHTQIGEPVGKDPANATEDVGRSHQITRTPGGLINETITVVHPPRGAISEECTKNLFQHRHAKVTVSKSRTLGKDHVEAAKDGVILAKSESLSESGWTLSEQRTEEQRVETVESSGYEDAFGTTLVHEIRSTAEDNYRGGRRFDAEKLIQRKDWSRTEGDLKSVKITEERPTECHTPWFQSKRKWFNDNNTYHTIMRFMEFRNATESQVTDWLREADSHDFGSFENSHVSISVNPSFAINKFKLYDGRISATCSVVPKNQSGGSTELDNWSETLIYVRIEFKPLRDSGVDNNGTWHGHMLKTVTKTTRQVGGGVGDGDLKTALEGQNELIEGSQISWDAAGKRFSYNIIKKIEVTNDVVYAADVQSYSYPSQQS